MNRKGYSKPPDFGKAGEPRLVVKAFEDRKAFAIQAKNDRIKAHIEASMELPKRYRKRPSRHLRVGQEPKGKPLRNRHKNRVGGTDEC